MENNSLDVDAVAPNAMDRVAEMVDLYDADFLLELLDTFLNESERLIAELGKEWRSGNSKQALLIAHSLKSSCATFFAQPLSDLAKALENELRDNAGLLDIPAQIDKIVIEYARVRSALALERLRVQSLVDDAE